ncbi:hypothetical protein [Sinomonas soli]
MTTSIPLPDSLTFAAAYLIEDQDLHVAELSVEACRRWVEDAYRLGYTTARVAGGCKVEVLDVDDVPWIMVSAEVRKVSEGARAELGQVLQLPAPVEAAARRAA